MPKTAPSPGRLAVIALFTLSCFGLLTFLWLAFGGTVPLKPQGYRVQVSFTDAAQLADQADVRVAGVPVGKVVEKRRDPAGNRTLATLELDAQYAPIARDARAVLRQKTLLGEIYVEMTLGTRGGPTLPENGRLADRQVAETVEFDEFLRVFDAPTRRVFKQWQASQAVAGRGRSQDISNALGSFPEFVESAGSLASILERRRGALGSLVRGTGQTFEALTRNEGALQGFIVDNARVFRTLSGRRDRIAETFQAFPAFLRETRATFERVATFSRTATPLVEDLEPVLADVAPTFTALGGLSPDLGRLFADLDPLIVAGRTGFPAMARILRGLDPTLASTGPVLQQLNPILEFLESHQVTLSDFFSIPPSAFGLKVPAPPGSGTNGHALPQVIVTGSQTLPAAQRTADNRGNAYFRPGWLADPSLSSPSRFIPPNYDCKHVGEKAPDETPGCFVDPPQMFQSKLQKFPRVEASREGGISRQAGRGDSAGN